MRLEDRILLVDKPKGLTSFAVVRRVRRAAGVRKVGHCGSLDPIGTGMLLVCTGVATRVAALFVDLPKEYDARVRFGRSTDSYDADGRVVEEAAVPELDPEVVRKALLTFEGPIEQVPPMVSALKHGGRRLYELARAGLDVERAPRRVMVYEIVLRELGAGHADIHIRCGRGCYVRSIAHDFGRLLGVPAHLEALRRSAVGPFRVADALQLDALEALAERAEGSARSAPPALPATPGVLSLPRALLPFPELVVRAGFERAVLHGAQPELRFFVDVPRGSGPCRLVSEDGRRLLAVGTTEGRMQFARVQLLRVFPEPIPIGEGDDAV